MGLCRNLNVLGNISLVTQPRHFDGCWFYSTGAKGCDVCKTHLMSRGGAGWLPAGSTVGVQAPRGFVRHPGCTAV